MTDKSNQGRFAQLDALRAFAVFIVLIHHFCDKRFFLAGFGVTLFFVLSGFFVTKSLLKLKQEASDGRITGSQALRMFYLQRWMRLWPLYYLVLALTLLFGVENARSSFLWNAAFLSNYQVLITGTWSGRFSPLWSLSVLEQFYLFWPALIIACPKKRLPALVFATIVIGPLYRLLCLVFNAGPLWWSVMPFASFDLLGCGALLALCTKSVVSEPARLRIMGIAGGICMPVFLLLLAGKAFGMNPPGSAVFIGTVASLAFVWLVQRTAEGFSGRTKVILENPLLCHIGRMSYSIFLLHNFVELLVPKVGFLRPLLASNYKLALLAPLSVLVAHVCWRLIEAPILSFRRKYVTTERFTRQPEVISPLAVTPAFAGTPAESL